MNNKINLINELKNDGWIIDLYDSFERYYSVLRLLALKEFGQNFSKTIKSKTKFNSWSYIYCQKNIVQGCMEEKEDLRNITVLFNKYLKIHEQDIWFCSVLAAMRQRRFVEYFHKVDKKWLKAPNTILTTKVQYRIDGI